MWLNVVSLLIFIATCLIKKIRIWLRLKSESWKNKNRENTCGSSLHIFFLNRPYPSSFYHGHHFIYFYFLATFHPNFFTYTWSSSQKKKQRVDTRPCKLPIGIWLAHTFLTWKKLFTISKELFVGEMVSLN
jgi:hypothetical protein